MLRDFKAFILRGNVVDLAVAVVIGAAFGAVISALVKDLITPLIAAIGGQPDFAGLSVTLHGSKLLYGEFLNALVSFLILAAVVFFLIVMPLNKLVERIKGSKTTEDPATKKCPECLSEIPSKAKRCAFCTSKV
jgi:large conductance mechanosensitive channel